MNKKDKETIIVGTGNFGKETAIELAKRNNTCNLHNVVDNQFTEPKKVFKITRQLIDIPTTYVDEKYVKGLKKHKQTCLKNRKTRKKKKRR